MKMKLGGFLVLLITFLLFPLQSFALEYAIDDVKINAYLQPDGTVEVNEYHTYSFEGEFNGITRSIIPKDGSEIHEFRAVENDSLLKVEKEDTLYKIHRKGEDETITVTLSYVIKNGVEIYQDVVQFYWPFFDVTNESTYENLTITIFPPKSTRDVIAFGYDTAFGKESIQADGSVLFQLGEVPSNTNGDIRVTYDSSLFSAGHLTADKVMKNEILAAKEKLLSEAKAFEEGKELLSKIANIFLPVFTFLLLVLVTRNWIEARSKLATAKRDVSSTNTIVPKQLMSLPATILFTNYNHLPPQAMAAALLDLVRKGLVKQVTKEKFQLYSRTGALEHEAILLKWLFDIIGEHKEFSFQDLDNYSKKEKNKEKYFTFQSEWTNSVKKEVKDNNFYEDKKKYRTMLGLSSLLLLPLLVFFIIYELLGPFAITLILFFFVIVYAIAYRPKTYEGVRLSYEWLLFKGKYKRLTPEEWGKWSEDDQMRAYIYALGVSDSSMQKSNEKLISAFSLPTSINTGFHPYSIYNFGYIGPIASTHFHSANDAGSATSSSGGGSISGGGTGGGGGGSGAF